MFALPTDPWAKTWACGSALFTDLALLLTLYSAFTTNGNWLSTALHVSRLGSFQAPASHISDPLVDLLKRS